ncbi:serine/threonine-protein phosphatase 1 regulatory subunit 10-like [Lucilia sericata]|uniref:serine/threonine-protein phosphatase 1 regulatory subunit 10-like n=1 Tax=Lucilia sericata TaxID=13632 RepID=UPI0018A80466|nr:serine/threonine-protein phosphatase 1 regulatory subunit 10-like [Lucilia sericata]
MPRIVPIQLLKCLKVLLDDNGGILSAGEVKRLASLMTKYSKKLVSKCIYVQILKCTKTELLGEFMGAGGWSLVYTWLNDAIRAMNWPLVQEILELLLLCPVDVHRLKINSAPKLVKGLCKDGGNEGVRILAKRLVEQWLKVVTENPEATLPTTNMTQQATQAIKTPTVAVVAPEAISVNVQQQQQTAMVNTANQNSTNTQQQQQQKQEEQKVATKQQKTKANRKAKKVQDFEEEEEEEEEIEDEEEDEEEEEKDTEQNDKDPLGGVDTEATVTNYTLTPAQKKASESGLVYKFIIKDGQSILAKVPPKTAQTTAAPTTTAQSSVEEEEEEETETNEAADDDNDESLATRDNANAVAEADDNSSSLDKTEKDNDSGSEDKTKVEDNNKKTEEKKSSEDKDKSSKDRRSSKDKERRGSTSSIDKDKDKDRDSKSSKSSSSSSSHRSSSHKSSSSSSKSSSSSSSKSKSSSSHRSSSDKHRSDKERSSSSKDKDRSSSSSSSSKHRSSSSKSSSSSSSSKDKYRDKEKSSSSSSSSSSSKSKDKQEQSDKDKNTLEKISSSSSLDKLGKIPKKSRDESEENSPKHTSITIPSKKASMSIEIRKDTEKAKTVKTYKSQFRSHGLTEEAPPPPSRKGLKKPSSATPPGTVLPSSLPSSLKRTSPPPRDLPSEKKAKIDINNVTVANEKPGAIKLIPPKKIQTLVETNLFSDALSAATGPKKVNKRKRPNTPLVNGKEDPTSPTSPDAPKVMPLKFYQDTLDESKTEDSKSDKENDETGATTKTTEENTTAEDKDLEDDDDIPLKKVKEDIEQKVAQEKKLDGADVAGTTIDITKDDEEKKSNESASSPSRQTSPRGEENDVEMVEEKKPGPGCGPNGPPGVLMLHRRKGPKKKLTWRPQETLEQVRYFELDENERCNVTKTSFMDMKNLERFNERDAIVMARRGFNQEDNMEPQTHWKPLVEVDDVPPHPEGNQSKQRKIQAERELTTLRALYFTHALIPDSPAEAEFEPAFNHDVPLIPLDDLTGNPDAVNDFTSMPWPEPRGSPKQGDSVMSGTGGLGSPVDMFGNSGPMPNVNNNNKQAPGNPFNPFVNQFPGNQGPNGPQMQNSPQNQWQGPANNMGGPMGGNGPMMGNPFNGNHGSPIMDMGGPGPMGPGHMMNNGPPQNFMNQFSNNYVGGPNNPFMNGPSNFNNGPNNFGPMGPNGPMMNGMGPGPMGNMMNGGHNNRNNNRGNNGGGNWRSGGSNFQDNNGGGGGGNWRPAGPGPNNRGGVGGINNNGVCKAFMRGHCRLGNSCKYIHPNKNKRI